MLEANKAKSMVDKAINHVIKARESKIKARWSFKEKGVWMVAKKLHPYPLNLKSKVWNLKIQWSDKKLWLQEVSGASICALTGFHDISTVLTPILTHQ